MSRFKELNNNINQILAQVIQNQNLCKLLSYDDNDPLSMSNIFDNTSLLFFKKGKYYFVDEVRLVHDIFVDYMNIFII